MCVCVCVCVCVRLCVFTRRWQLSTIISFCWGEVLANTISGWFRSASSNSSLLISFSWPPLITQARASLHADNTETDRVTYNKQCKQWISCCSHTLRHEHYTSIVKSVTVMQIPLVDLFDGYALSLGNIFHCFAALWDDTNISCYCPCCDWMIPSHHDNLKFQDIKKKLWDG